MFADIAKMIRQDVAAGFTGRTLETTPAGPVDFTPAAGLHSFAIGGGGVPEKKVKRVTARTLKTWLKPYCAPGTLPRFLGWWVEDGVIVLDAPTIWSGLDYDATREKAVRLGRERGERAIYDFTAGKEIFLTYL